MTAQALSGVRVLDLTQVMAGPFCTMLLGDLGADVIKIERPDGGDQTRHSWGYPPAGSDSPAFYSLNRNKRSICLDLHVEQDRQEFYRLAADADVIVENFRPGVVEKLGVDYDTVSKINPAIIYASISGFGHDGPYAQRPGYDLVAQAMAGAMSVTGEPGGRPVKCGLPIGDLGAGLFCAYGILGAYLHRTKTGEGQYLETSLYEAVLAMSVWESTEYWATGEPPAPLGSANRMSAPYQALCTKDGYVTIGANNQRLWRKFCDAIGMPDLATDPRFAGNMDRMNNRSDLIAILESKLVERDTSEWVDVLLAAGVPAGPILNYQQVLDDDPHAAARHMVQRIPHPTEGEVPALGFAVKLNRTPARTWRHPPRLGEHTEQVKREKRDRGRPD